MNSVSDCGAGGHDGTRYGTSRTSPKDFYHHHAQQISVAVIRGDVRNALKRLSYERRVLSKETRATVAVGGEP